MSMDGVRHQMPASAGQVAEGQGEASSQAAGDEAPSPRHATINAGQGLLAQVLARENMQRAWQRVKANKGAAGMDGMDMAQTGRYLVTALPTIRNQLMAGTYRRSPVRHVGISKPDGSERELGIDQCNAAPHSVPIVFHHEQQSDGMPTAREPRAASQSVRHRAVISARYACRQDSTLISTNYSQDDPAKNMTNQLNEILST